MIQRAQDFDPSISLCLEDVSVDSHSNPTMVCIRLKQSKTDPFRHRVDVFVGHTDSNLCLVAAILSYVAVRPSVTGPLFVFHDRQPLTRDRLVQAVCQALSSAGVDTSAYSGHSFRIGAATTAALAGLEDSLIKMLGRWESDAFQWYLRSPRESLAAVSK